MNAQLAPEDSDIESAPNGAQALLRSVVITDLCDSTALVDRLGDVRATELIRAHDRLLRGLIREHRGQEIDKTDGFLSLFERPIQAVAFALAYQRGLRAFSLEHGVEISARIGLHVGEVMTWQNDEADVAKGAKPTEVEGLAKPVAARLMGMALPGQILLSGVAYTLAHRAEGELGAALSRLQWKAHGDFRFKGVAEAVPVYEIGEEGIAPFKAPAWSGKAHREVPLWRRPAVLAFEVIALVAAVALPTWHFLTPEPAIAFAERDWVVLADLRNLTGDPRFDDSLEQAFRIGLEQSRHVNVVSPMRIRETLQLMQLDPDKASIDRPLGSEIAMREQARALILPTLAEVGGRLRFTVEVVAPQSQTTVLSLAADGDSVESALVSLDQINQELRRHLGETVQRIEEDSLELQRAATPSIEALRAFSLAFRANLQNRLPDALALLDQALRIDPEFAMALHQRGVVLRNSADREGAKEALRAALALSERMSRRDRLEAEAFLAELEGRPRVTLDTWRTMLEIYPDTPGGYSTLGFYQWVLANNRSEAASTLRTGLAASRTDRGLIHYTLGAVLLGQDRVEESLAAFEAYEQTERRLENQFYAAAHASRRDFNSARKVLARGTRGGLPTREPSGVLLEAILALDEGEFHKVWPQLDRLQVLAATLPKRFQQAVLMWSLSARAQLGNPEFFEAALRDSQSAFATAGDGTDLATEFDRERVALISAWLAARSGHTALAEFGLARVDGARLERSHPELWQRLQIARAALDCSLADVESGLGRLAPILDSGSAFYSAHATRMQCELAAGDRDAALRTARWLADHRGLAYSEIHGDYALWLWNVAHSTLVLLQAAEIAAAEDRALAEPWLREFRQRWSGEELPEAVELRLDRLLVSGP